MDYFDPRDYGYVADAVQGGGAPSHCYIGTDNTLALQTAINLAKNSAYSRRVFIPPGFAMISHINGQDAHEVELFGDGIGRSVLLPNADSAGKHVLDFLGAGGLVLRDFGAGRAAFNPAGNPQSILRYGVGAGSGNAARFERISLYGKTNAGTFTNEGAPSSILENCFFYTFGNSAPALTMSGATGWKFDNVEIHELEVYRLKQENPAYQGYGGSITARFTNCEDMTIDSGNIGGNGPRAIDFHGTNKRFILTGTEIYAQDPVGQAYNGLVRNNGVLEDSSFFNCRMDASSYLFGGPTGCVYRGIRLYGQVNQGNAPKVFATEGPIQLIDSEIDAYGKYIDLGGGIVRGCRVWNTSGFNVSQKIATIWTDTAGRLHVSEPIIVG